jgi:hypothetical protein
MANCIFTGAGCGAAGGAEGGLLVWAGSWVVTRLNMQHTLNVGFNNLEVNEFTMH